MRLRTTIACVCFIAASAHTRALQPSRPDGIERLVAAVEQAIDAADAGRLRAMVTRDAPADHVTDFVAAMTEPAVSSATVKERDRTVTDTGTIRVLVEILTDRNAEGSVSAWRLDLVPSRSADPPWLIADVERLTVVSGLYRLSLDPATEFDVHQLTIRAPDLSLTLPSGRAFIAKSAEGPTAMVLLGRGRAEFAPKPEAERGQLRIFSGSEKLRMDFGAVFLRMNPSEYLQKVGTGTLTPRAVDGSELQRARGLFNVYLPQTFALDLGDLSTARWSLVPSAGDFVAEIMTRKYGPLTYARSMSEPEDISFFDRRGRRNIAVYASEAKLASRGRFYSEDDHVDFEVTHYDVDVSFAPDRLWVEGTARLSVRLRSALTSTLTLRLAEPLVVRSVSSPQFGRLLHLRVIGQNDVLVGFPGAFATTGEFDVIVTYGGRLPPQPLDREAIGAQQERQQRDLPQQEQIVIPPEPQYVYSNRSYWYPQANVTQYATANLTLTVPGDMDVVASGTERGEPQIVPPAPGQQHPRRRFVFEAASPARYLACAISRLQAGPATTIAIPGTARSLRVSVVSNSRQASRARQVSEKIGDMLSFYAGLMKDAPYGSFELALMESDLPGGHSPPYFAIVNDPMPTSRFVWSNDPVAFQDYPSFFLAHEVAHQWWGQGVGWKNYHEQWISEGFAQYFAAMYAEHERGPDTLTGVLRQMRRWAIEMSPQGPVYLGYRLGHIRSDGRVFRALVYNKGAMVLHMLRRFVGDESFFAGLRDFYETWRYTKAGTDDFRAAMEKASGRPLERFFERWIYGDHIPSVRFTSAADDSRNLRLRFEETGDEIFDLPVTVTVTYTDGHSDDIVVALSEKTTERSIPLRGTVRSVEVNRDGAALARFVK
jgi:peptidase M1-like protein